MEEAPKDKYPRVTRNQLDIWLDDPCTVALGNICESQIKVLRDFLADGKFYGDGGGNEKAMNTIMATFGRMSELEELLNLHALFDSALMIGESDEG